MEGNGFQEAQKPVEASDPLKQRLEQAVQREAPEGFPKILINIFYSRHATKEDLNGFRKRLKESDIYIPEEVGLKKENLRLLNKFSFGTLSPSWGISILLNVLPSSGFDLEIARSVRNSFKPIAVIDLPAEQPMYKDYEKTLESFIQLAYHGDFSSALNTIKESAKKMAEGHRQREDYMVSQLLPKIKEVLERFPDLRKKKELRVLMTLGSYHTAVYQDFIKSGLDVKRKFHATPYVFMYSEEVLRRYAFGKEVNDQLAAKTMLQWWFYGDLLKGYRGKMEDGKEFPFIRKVIGEFDLRDAEEIYNLGLTIKNKRDLRKERLKLFFAKLNQKGIALPRTEKELNEFLAKPLPPRPNSQPPKQQLQ